MNRKRIVLGFGVVAAVLALCLSAFAALHVAVNPGNAVVTAGTGQTVTFDGFCSFTPCNITWILVESNSNVGSIDNTTGPVSTFTAGSVPGTAYLFVSDGNGHMAQAKIDVQ